MARTASRTTSKTKQSPQKVLLLREHREPGFTIVELLIVVVVIAILAAITIVAYNGISNRAKSSAASSAVQQATKKVMTYATANAEQYPATLTDAGIVDGTTTFQYRVNNTSDPKTFCITATTQNVSYYSSSTQTIPTAGACAGHGVNGAVAITNLHTNPRVLINTGLANQTPANGTSSLVAGAGPEGQQVFRVTTTVSGQLRIQFKGGGTPVSQGEQYNFSVYAKASAPVSGVNFEVQQDNTWTKYPVQSLSTSWTRLSGVVIVPSGVTALNNAQLLTDGSVPSGLTVEMTKFQITNGSTLYGYGDGSYPGWIWNGTTNNSTSTGSAP